MEIINKNRLLANTIDHIYRYTLPFLLGLIAFTVMVTGGWQYP